MPEPLSSVVVDAARAALLEITPADSIGELASETVEGDGITTVQFHSALAGYPGWRWTVSLSTLDEAEPSILETELIPGDGSLLAPDWVPWSDRLAEYKAAQEAAEAEAAEAAVDGAESDDSDDDSDDSDDSDDDSDDDDDDDLGSDVLHGGDLDGVDIDIDEDALDEDESDDDESDDDDSDDDDSDDDDSDDDDSDESDDDSGDDDDFDDDDPDEGPAAGR